ncbi:SRPBCC domain-containing protein [Streptomyces sp. NPDC090022]|uniref:SRPBCC domain-containing protein n=1 Tax=Streptomyces sp. NPDC090022 TaxID=3365920 RepID=UPI003807D988
MDSTTFLSTTYIRTTPERLWQALTDPAFTDRYWGVTFENDWAKGSPLVWKQGGVTIAHPEQVVLVCDPYRRLSYTWHTFTEEWAGAVGVDEDVRARLAAERRSTVTFDRPASPCRTPGSPPGSAEPGRADPTRPADTVTRARRGGWTRRGPSGEAAAL